MSPSSSGSGPSKARRGSARQWCSNGNDPHDPAVLAAHREVEEVGGRTDVLGQPLQVRERDSLDEHRIAADGDQGPGAADAFPEHLAIGDELADRRLVQGAEVPANPL